MYNGPYVNPRKGVAAPKEVDKHLQALKQNVLVAVVFEDYTKIPVIGKVLKVNQETIKICYLKGSWRTPWCPWRKDNALWVDELPKSCILLLDFKLNEMDKLESETTKCLKKVYKISHEAFALLSFNGA